MSSKKEIWERFLWVSIGFIASLPIAHVITKVEDLISANILIGAFIPVVVYICDAVGTQSETFTIRSLAEEKKFSLRKYFKHQVLINLSIAALIGVLSFVSVNLIYKDPKAALVIALGLISGIIASLFTGVTIPYYSWKFHQDPAAASGPMATVIQDFVSVMLYLGIASIVLG